MKAAIKRFVSFCDQQGLALHDRCFSVRYETNIPRQVGLAGSSAIIVATLRALMEYYDVEIPLDVQPSLVLSIEQNELGITAGLQDRVIQVYEGMVSMDFSAESMRKKCGLMCGRYERLDYGLLPKLYLAWSASVSEPIEVFHNNLRYRYDTGEPAVVDALSEFAQLALNARQALLEGAADQLARCIDRNFDLRRNICRLPQNQERIVDCARSTGATAKFAGSGGAIVGTFSDELMFDRLGAALASLGCRTVRIDRNAEP